VVIAWFCRTSRLQFSIVLQFFRNNQFFVAIPLVLYVFALHFGALFGFLQPASVEPLQRGLLFQDWFGWAQEQPFYSALLAALLVSIQAIMVNKLADEFRLMSDRNWFPGLFYALVASLLPEFLFVTAPLVAATFVLLSIWSIYAAFQKPNVTGAIFDAGLWIAVAGLFYPPAIFLLVAAFFGLGIVRVFQFRERMVLLSGVFVPNFLAWVWYFWADEGAAFRDAQWGNLFQFNQFDAVWNEVLILKTALISTLSLIFIYGLGALNNRKGIQSQKFVGVLYWFLVLGASTALFARQWLWEHLLLTAAAMGLLLAMTFQEFRSRFWAEMLHFLLLCFVLFIQFAEKIIPLANSIF